MATIARLFVAVTFVNDKASAIVQGRDISDLLGNPVTSITQLKEGSKVLAYWASDFEFFEAIVRRVSGWFFLFFFFLCFFSFIFVNYANEHQTTTHTRFQVHGD